MLGTEVLVFEVFGSESVICTIAVFCVSSSQCTAMVWSAVCGCGLSWSYSLTFCMIQPPHVLLHVHLLKQKSQQVAVYD